MWSRLALHSQSFSYNTEIPDASHHSTGDIFKNQFNIGMHVCMMSLCGPELLGDQFSPVFFWD